MSVRLKNIDRDERRARGEAVRGREPKRATETPHDRFQINFTDPDSRIMKAGNVLCLNGVGFRHIVFNTIQKHCPEYKNSLIKPCSSVH
jgi:hypothetical protein